MADEHAVNRDIQDSLWPMRNKDEEELGGVVMREDPSFELEVLPRESIDQGRSKYGHKAETGCAMSYVMTDIAKVRHLSSSNLLSL